jgi:CxxC motif-containing protein (DUF1111 family)
MKTTTLPLLIATSLAVASSGLAQSSPPPQRRAQRPHQNHTPPAQQRPADPARPQFGDPLPNLTAAQLAAFYDGKDDFAQAETPEGGLGPIFNRSSCLACHSQPIIGGSSAVNVTRFGLNVNGVFDPLADLGGSLLQDNSILGHGIEQIPADANVIAHRQSTPLFGLGLIEAIPDDVIFKGIKNGSVDGVKGKASVVQDVATGKAKVGRFGWKAQQANLLSFAADAYVNEMGVTNRFFPTENAPNGDTKLLAQLDSIADPEDVIDPTTGKADIDRAADFMRLLAPPPRGPVTASANAGAALFQQVNCAACHTPQMMTGPSPISAINQKPVPLYSDLLLHDMGTLGDGIAQGTAGVKEMKTPPLWGLRASAPYLHDGRAATVDAAIQAHDGEGKAAKDRYLKLTPQQRQQLTDFLMSL